MPVTYTPKVGSIILKKELPQEGPILLNPAKDGSPEHGFVLSINAKDTLDFEAGNKVMYFNHRATAFKMGDDEALVVPVDDVLAVVEA